MRGSKQQPRGGEGQLPTGRGESAIRREAMAENGGTPSPEQLEDGQRRGADEDGRATGGTHGGPTKEGTTKPKSG